MTNVSDLDAAYVGASAADAIYLGSNLVWQPSGGGGFAPTSLTNLELWYPSETLTGLSDGDPIASQADSSGHNRTRVQATSGLKPIYKPALVNGLAGIRYDGADDVLKYTGSAFITGAALTFFGIYVHRSDTGNSAISALMATADPADFAAPTSCAIGAFGLGNELQNVRNGGNFDVYTDSETAAFGDPFVLIAIFAADGTSKMRITDAGGTTEKTSTGAGTENFAIDTAYFGRRYSFGLSTAAAIDTIDEGLYSDAKTGTDLTDLETYLIGRAGL